LASLKGNATNWLKRLKSSFKQSHLPRIEGQEESHLSKYSPKSLAWSSLSQKLKWLVPELLRSRTGRAINRPRLFVDIRISKIVDKLSKLKRAVELLLRMCSDSMVMVRIQCVRAMDVHESGKTSTPRFTLLIPRYHGRLIRSPCIGLNEDHYHHHHHHRAIIMGMRHKCSCSRR
jgi:hypothetical protein